MIRGEARQLEGRRSASPLLDESGADQRTRPLVTTARCAEIGAAVPRSTLATGLPLAPPRWRAQEEAPIPVAPLPPQLRLQPQRVPAQRTPARTGNGHDECRPGGWPGDSRTGPLDWPASGSGGIRRRRCQVWARSSIPTVLRRFRPAVGVALGMRPPPCGPQAQRQQGNESDDGYETRWQMDEQDCEGPEESDCQRPHHPADHHVRVDRNESHPAAQPQQPRGGNQDGKDQHRHVSSCCPDAADGVCSAPREGAHPGAGKDRKPGSHRCRRCDEPLGVELNFSSSAAVRRVGRPVSPGAMYAPNSGNPSVRRVSVTM